MKHLEFTKVVASGNDFIILSGSGTSPTTTLDVKKKLPKNNLAELSKKLCNRRFSIGADGVMLLLKSKKADLRMRIFNPDGSEADMCGNGLRCLALYAFKKGIGHKNLRIETNAGILRARLVKNDYIRLEMTEPKTIRLDFNIHIDGVIHKVNFINTGVPHAVYFVKDLDNFDVKHIGQKTRFHEEFRPEGTNADFVEILDSKNIKIRTYERGVEDETLSCGTGTVAGAIVAGLLKNIEAPISVHTRSGEILKVDFKKDDVSVNGVTMEGKAKIVFEGRINI